VIWCDDGWSYIPQKSIRRKFMSDSSTDIAEYIEEVWPGLVPGKVVYEESIMFVTYKLKPKMWSESTMDYKELFVEQAV